MNTTPDLSWLSRLRFVTRKRRQGGSWGERRSARRGAGLEFADYRDYTPGDDPRRVDWNLYARLDRPYVRLFEEEEDLAVTVLLDGSASMTWGERWPVAQQLAAALGTLALLSSDALSAATLGATPATVWGPTRGRGHIAHWQPWCLALQPGATGALASALRQWAARPGRPGLILLITDGYDQDGLSAGIAALAARRHEVHLLHLLTPEELEPPLRGDLRLVDVESGIKREVTLDRIALEAYARRLDRWQAELRALAGKHGGRYALLRTDAPVKRLVLENLRSAGIVR